MSRTRGQAVEEAAEAWLVRQGLRPLRRNYRLRLGEIDLIMEDGKVLVFVEVRLRRNPGFASAAESVDARKRQKLVRTAESFLQQEAWARRRPCRFDVVACDGTGNFDWIKNAIES